MFARLFGPPATPILTGASITLRAAQRSDYAAWAKLRQDSHDFLQPWEPSWSDNELSRTMFHERRTRGITEANAGSGYVFFIFDTTSTRLVGGITLGAVRYGVARSGQIGYWMGQEFAGKGLMQDAVLALCGFAFGHLGLHRLEAACIPSNTRSINVLEKTGFKREGLLKSYLKINGEWQDHLLFAQISGVTEQ